MEHICELEEPKANNEVVQEGKEDKATGADLVQGEISGAWTLTGAKFAPQQVGALKI